MAPGSWPLGSPDDDQSRSAKTIAATIRVHAGGMLKKHPITVVERMVVHVHSWYAISIGKGKHVQLSDINTSQVFISLRLMLDVIG